MRQMSILLVLFILTFSTLSCRPTLESSATSTPCPTPETPASNSDPTVVPTPHATLTPRVPPPNYTRTFLSNLLTANRSCLPDKTAEDIGVYIYDLTNNRELVSINADVPFQFASAFKAPVLVYFLSSCRQIWDSSDPLWKKHFQNLEAAQGIKYYTSPDYESAVSDFIADPRNWKNVGVFFTKHRYSINSADGDIDTRYFVLEKVYSMIAQSANLATADVLQYVFENCARQESVSMEELCGGPNALIRFNAWFNDFATIEYENKSLRRGLYEYDTILINGEELTLSTFGQRDVCAIQTATLKCDSFSIAYNVFTARDLFKFYNSLSRSRDDRLRETALSLLQADEPGPARGNLKNLARTMQTISLSKNGHAFYNNGSINTDAGIFRYKGREYIVVTLSFNALDSMIRLYGSYDEKGELVSDPGLIQNLLEEITP